MTYLKEDQNLDDKVCGRDYRREQCVFLKDLKW